MVRHLLASCGCHIAFLAGLLLLHVAFLLENIQQNFATVDEAGHIPAGLSNWQTDTFSLYRVNPPLYRMVAVAPVLWAGAKIDYTLMSKDPAQRSDWAMAGSFARINGAEYLKLVRLARLAGIGWSVLAGLLIYFWAKDLYGRSGGILALTLWCFSPNVLGHASLVTPDIPAATAALAALYVFRQYLRSPCWPLAFFAGLVLGLAQLTKFSLLLFYVILPFLYFAYRAKKENLETPHAGKLLVARQGGLILVLSFLVINLGYQFDGSFQLLGDFPFVSNCLAGETKDRSWVGNRFQSSWLGWVPVPFPKEYVQGIDFQKREFERRLFSYLNGEWRDRGWWYYYLFAFLYKSPLGALLLVLAGGALAVIGHEAAASCREEFFLWFPALAFLVFISSQTGFNHHLRYVFPVIPFVLISAGKLAWFCKKRRWTWGLVVLGLLFWSLTSSYINLPHSLSYFNELAGGPEKGHDHLVNSNIDWGQDLLFLKKWLDNHPEAKPMGLAYFNVVDPYPVLGLEYELPAFGPEAGTGKNSGAEKRGPYPGWFAVSVNLVRGGSSLIPDGTGGGQYVPLHAFEYFRFFQPVAKAGYSIYIYQITLEKANQVRERIGLPLLSGGNQHLQVQP